MYLKVILGVRLKNLHLVLFVCGLPISARVSGCQFVSFFYDLLMSLIVYGVPISLMHNLSSFCIFYVLELNIFFANFVSLQMGKTSLELT